jgi:peptidoglycan/LPS O-acetylase OafA/YrhL
MIFVLSYLTGLPSALKVVASLVLTGLLSFVSFHAIEDPLIRLGKHATIDSQKRPVLKTFAS